MDPPTVYVEKESFLEKKEFCGKEVLTAVLKVYWLIISFI